jgi:hypothetical protein
MLTGPAEPKEGDGNEIVVESTVEMGTDSWPSEPERSQDCPPIAATISSCSAFALKKPASVNVTSSPTFANLGLVEMTVGGSKGGATNLIDTGPEALPPPWIRILTRPGGPGGGMTTMVTAPGPSKGAGVTDDGEACDEKCDPALKRTAMPEIGTCDRCVTDTVRLKPVVE